MTSLIKAVADFGLLRVLCILALVTVIQGSAQRIVSRGLAVRRRELIDDLRSAGNLSDQGDFAERKIEIIGLLYDDLRSLIVSAHRRKSAYLSVIRGFPITVVCLISVALLTLSCLFEGGGDASQMLPLVPLLALFAVCFVVDMLLYAVARLAERVTLGVWQRAKMKGLDKRLSEEEKKLSEFNQQLYAIDNEIEELETRHYESCSKAVQSRLQELGVDLNYISSALREERVWLHNQKLDLANDIDQSETGLTKDIARDYRKTLIAAYSRCFALLHELCQLECYLSKLNTDITSFVSD